MVVARAIAAAANVRQFDRKSSDTVNGHIHFVRVNGKL